MILIPFLAGFGVLILVILIHEAGHLLAAKAVGIPVRVFSVGFGPRLASVEWQGTEYRLCLLPLGGYVRIAPTSEIEDMDELDKLSKPRRFAFLAGGIMANAVTAWLVVSMAIIPLLSKVDAPIRGSLVVTEVMRGGPADRAGVQVGDRIDEVGGRRVRGSHPSTIVRKFKRSEGRPLSVSLSRDGRPADVSIVPQERGGRIGLVWDVVGDRGFGSPTTSAVGTGVHQGADVMTQAFGVVWKSFGRLATGRAGAEDVAGPIGIARAGAEAFRAGWLQVVFLFCFLSANVALFNLLPFPGLDGGHLAFLLIETGAGRPVPKRIRAGITYVGVFMMILSMAMAMWIDIRREAARHFHAPPGMGTRGR